MFTYCGSIGSAAPTSSATTIVASAGALGRRAMQTAATESTHANSANKFAGRTITAAPIRILPASTGRHVVGPARSVSQHAVASRISDRETLSVNDSGVYESAKTFSTIPINAHPAKTGQSFANARRTKYAANKYSAS